MWTVIFVFVLKNFCLYKLGIDNQMVSCIKGDHLVNCAKFECNAIFKCPGYYCINWSYVCDGKWDCPYGEDESNINVCIGDNICHNMYKCSHVHRCISLGNVCDEQSDCLFNDDGMLCDLKSVQCPEFCVCLSYAITCNRLKVGLLQANLASFLKVSFSESYIDSINTLEHKLKDTYFIYLPRNNITTICPLMLLKKLILLDLQFNYLLQINTKCFSASIFLRMLNLNSNNIFYLSIYSFYNLHYLRFLNLSRNSFVILPSKSFFGMFNLKVMCLGNKKFTEVHEKVFFYANVRIIMTPD